MCLCVCFPRVRACVLIAVRTHEVGVTRVYSLQFLYTHVYSCVLIAVRTHEVGVIGEQAQDFDLEILHIWRIAACHPRASTETQTHR